MHDTAMETGKAFFDTYVKDLKGLTIVDIGSQDVNGSLRTVAPKNNQYIGLDFEKGKGVDKLITDPYSMPFEEESVDVVVSSSCFEHSEFFWLVFNEALRILKPTGLLYINAPSNGKFHRYPYDCWRFYPDSGFALQNWGKRKGYNCALLESFTAMRKDDLWNDFVAVFIKNEIYSVNHPKRIQNTSIPFENGRLYKSDDIVNYSEYTEDQFLGFERDKLVNERDVLVNERDKLVNERDVLVNERDSLLNSRSWRITRPLRWIMKFFNK